MWQTEQGYRNGYAFTQTRLWGMPIQTTFGSEISGNWQMTRLWSYLHRQIRKPIANALCPVWFPVFALTSVASPTESTGRAGSANRAADE